MKSKKSNPLVYPGDEQNAICAVAETLESIMDTDSCDICGHVTEMAQKLFIYLGVSAKYATNGTHDWIMLGEMNVDFGARQYEDILGFSAYPYVTFSDDKDSMRFYGKPTTIANEVNVNYPSLKELKNSSKGRKLLDLLEKNLSKCVD